jgi:phosphoribosylformimino-5-aminoimidazole carboxamide ribotide isomerase
MDIVPAMDLRADRCVHTERDGNHFDHVIKQDPLAVAASWAAAGASTLYLVDLDGFQHREPRNVHTVRELREAFPDQRLIVSGGVCCEEHILIWLDAGVDAVTMTQKNIRSQEYLEALGVEFPGRVYIGVELSPQGTSGLLARRYGSAPRDLVAGLDADGLSGVVFHGAAVASGSARLDIPGERDLEVLWHHPARHRLTDQEVLDLAADGVDGLVLGRALYEGSISYSALTSLLTTGGARAS